MNQIVSTRLQRLWEGARITRNVTLMARTTWLALVKAGEGLFINREAECVWKRRKKKKINQVVRYSKGDGAAAASSLARIKSEAEWARWKNGASSMVIKSEKRTKGRSI